MSQTAPAAPSSSARVMTIIAFVLGAIGLIFFPIVFGPVGAVLGFIGLAKGDRLGLWAGIFCIAATIAGIALSYAVYSNM
ncbi:hypothetical protein [Nocardioides zeae]|uniref:DUF4190 domain-containing protein n=1 Tax=Nocardioides zeae TaxID=1457234 RepID=A0A6P0HLB9_9ACTN|nr:hypothetical protein [Nocardioides zeae]NEN79090.1 hypothetical protein [Nocardioides zeae]